MNTRWILYKTKRGKRQMCGVFHDKALAEQIKELQEQALNNTAKYILKEETYSDEKSRKAEKEIKRLVARIRAQKTLAPVETKQTRPRVNP